LPGLSFPVGVQISFNINPRLLSTEILPAEVNADLTNVYVSIPKFGLAANVPIAFSSEFLDQDCGSPLKSCYPWRSGLTSGKVSVDPSKPLVINVFGPMFRLVYKEDHSLEKIDLNAYANVSFSYLDKKLFPPEAYAKNYSIFTPFYNESIDPTKGLTKIGWNIQIMKEKMFKISVYTLDLREALEIFINRETKILKDNNFWKNIFYKLRPKGIYLEQWEPCSHKSELESCQKLIGNDKNLCLSRFEESKKWANNDQGSVNLWCLKKL
jgi:hypothetical protein